MSSYLHHEKSLETCLTPTKLAIRINVYQQSKDFCLKFFQKTILRVGFCMVCLSTEFPTKSYLGSNRQNPSENCCSGRIFNRTLFVVQNLLWWYTSSSAGTWRTCKRILYRYAFILPIFYWKSLVFLDLVYFND